MVRPCLRSKTVVLGVIGSDCHAVGNKIIEHALTREGFNVINIGGSLTSNNSGNSGGTP